MPRQDWEYRREIVLPFSLQLIEGRELRCEKILRLLPGRRLVCRADQNGKPVLVKLFLDKDGQQKATEDARGVKAMMSAGINTPPLRLETRVEGKGYPALLFDYVPQARSFRQSWIAAPEEQRMDLLKDLLLLVAGQHQAGLRQRDFHLNNFILDARGKLYAIDGGDLIVANHPAGEKASIANLGVLFGHLPQQLLSGTPRFLDVYFEQRGWDISAHIRQRISKAANVFRHRRAQRISRKAFRNCSEFVTRRQGDLHICQRRDFPQEALDAWVQSTHLSPRPEEAVFKPGNSQTVWLSRIADQEVVIKRYNLKTRWHALRRMFTRSRASRSWENAHRLRAYHIDTPAPLAMIEERRFGLRRRAWLVTARAKGIGANRYVPGHTDENTVKRLASVVRAFAENNLVHGDMKATNFMMTEETVEVIDLDSMFRPLTAPVLRARLAKDHRRFLHNWDDARLRQRFAMLLKQEPR